MELGQIIKQVCVKIHEHFEENGSLEREEETDSHPLLWTINMSEFDSTPGLWIAELFIRF